MITCVLSTNEGDIYAFREIKPKQTFLFLTETQIQISRYRLMTNHSTDGGRGITIHAREEIQVGIVDIKLYYEQWLEQIWISIINLPGGPIAPGCLYRSPTSTSIEDSLLAMHESFGSVARNVCSAKMCAKNATPEMEPQLVIR